MKIDSGMKKETIELLRSKTFRAASAAMIYAGVGLASGKVDLQSGIEMFFGAAIAIAIRHALAKLGPVAKPDEDALIEKFIGDLASQSDPSDKSDSSDESDRRALNLGDRRK